jgi:hypothetical protein
MNMFLRRQERPFRARIGNAEFLDRVEVFQHVAGEGHGIRMRIEVSTFLQRVCIDEGREVPVYRANHRLLRSWMSALATE